jgi:hypothetical protein
MRRKLNCAPVGGRFGAATSRLYGDGALGSELRALTVPLIGFDGAAYRREHP